MDKRTKWMLKNKEKWNKMRDKSTAIWRENNPDRYRAHSISRLTPKRRIHKNQTPKWSNRKAIINFYLNTPKGYVVDHIIPLKSPYVCGLHVENNLQYLTREENGMKSNNVAYKRESLPLPNIRHEQGNPSYIMGLSTRATLSTPSLG